MAESAPLLEERHEELEGQTNAPSERTPPRPVYFKILTIITVGLSAVTLGLLIANHIIIRNAPFTGFYWSTLDANVGLEQFVLVSLIFSIINLLVNFPIPLNMIVDIVLAPAMISWAVRLIIAFPNGWCRELNRYPGPGMPYPYPETDPKCKDWELVAKILTGVVAGLGGILGLVYIILLILRGVALFRSKFWKKPIGLNFPSGQISLEISLKFLRQEGGATENTVGQTAEASSSSGHGPVYL
ncbi:hypothetical protein GALMADRAFT_145508 [Galerina marginata CBS 339.88]|uniref:MARVEL domain-containing protein n=1 Tax=Galerina marginata (strain CBS 339.88) TaxID=685588 RepID=A0A067SEY1_GALM3|nr:hypothetical protein GALMADRAFT_145508 [Galerina marginata CBS 339.88]